MKDRFEFITAQTPRIEAIVGAEEMELAAFHNGRYNPKDFVLISIQTPGDKIKLKSKQKKFKKFLSVSFNDVIETTVNFDGEILEPMDIATANRILDFILENKDEKFFIHCNAGVSRSAGVATALECILGFDGDLSKFDLFDNAIYNHRRYTTNTFVRDTIIELFNSTKN